MRDQPSPRRARSTVVIGLGNRFRRDDAAGLQVARRVAERAPDGTRVIEHEGDPVDLLTLWADADLAIVVDAVRAPGDEPGRVLRLEPDGAGDGSHHGRDSSHALAMSEAIALARALDLLPRRLVVYGIVGRDFGAGAGPTARVVAGVRSAAEQIIAELAEVTSCA